MSRIWHALLIIQLILCACATAYFISMTLIEPPPDKPVQNKGHKL